MGRGAEETGTVGGLGGGALPQPRVKDVRAAAAQRRTLERITLSTAETGSRSREFTQLSADHPGDGPPPFDTSETALMLEDVELGAFGGDAALT